MSTSPRPGESSRWRDLRPLDQFRSIKSKLGVLVTAVIVVSSTVTAIGYEEGLRHRYSIPIAVVAALAVTQLLAHGMTLPLREMTAAARAMARGDYSRRVTTRSRDEVGELARAFNTMAADLAAADRQRKELVANVSHELRTPISALQALLENLVDGVSEPDPESLQRALAQTQRLGRLVTQLLDLSRVDAGVVPLDRERLPVEPFLREVVGELEMSGRPVHYEVRVGADELEAWADRERLHQVVANLLDNASRHSPAGGTVTVTADAGAAGAVRIEVVDDGPGIPVESRERVFDRFTGAATPGKDGGTGLGLSIARWVVDLHGGTIAVADSPSGCRIRVDLPGQARQAVASRT